MSIPVPACSAAACGTWEELFCICTEDDETNGICTPAVLDQTNDFENDYSFCYPGYDPGSVDQIDGLLGQYSTTAASASILPSTGADLATWSNIDSARLDNNGAYATVSPTPIFKPTGGFFQTCFQGTNYIVLAGFGDNGHFEIPAGSVIQGIAVGAKGYGTRSSAVQPGALHVWNVALMLGGIPYYRADPRTYGIKQESGHTTIPCGELLASDPYPVNCAPHGQNPYYVQPLGNIAPGGSIQSGQIDSRNSFLPGDTMPSIVSLEWFAGDPGACANGFDTLVKSSVSQKDMFIPTAKQIWTADEINDETFGIAFSVYGTNQRIGASNTTLTLHLDCVGVAVYYTPGSIAPSGTPRSPNTFVIT